MAHVQYISQTAVMTAGPQTLPRAPRESHGDLRRIHDESPTNHHHRVRPPPQHVGAGIDINKRMDRFRLLAGIDVPAGAIATS